MATTTPDNIYSPDAGQQYALTQDLLAMADSVQDALTAERDALAPLIPGAPVIRYRFMAGENAFTNVSSYTALPVAVDRDALAATLTKNSSSTRLIVRMSGTLVYRAGNTKRMYLGININGADYDVARVQAPDAVARVLLIGEVEIPRVPAGSLTVGPRFRSSGANTVSFYTEDYINYSIQEVP